MAKLLQSLLIAALLMVVIGCSGEEKQADGGMQSQLEEAAKAAKTEPGGVTDRKSRLDVKSAPPINGATPADANAPATNAPATNAPADEANAPKK